jgi:hypothetical protein
VTCIKSLFPLLCTQLVLILVPVLAVLLRPWSLLLPSLPTLQGPPWEL